MKPPGSPQIAGKRLSPRQVAAQGWQALSDARQLFAPKKTESWVGSEKDGHVRQ
jgi:hypothetical protein